MLADHHFDRRLYLSEDLTAEIGLIATPELRQVSAKQHEVGLRIERINVLDGFDRAPHEALIERARI